MVSLNGEYGRYLAASLRTVFAALMVAICCALFVLPAAAVENNGTEDLDGIVAAGSANNRFVISVKNPGSQSSVEDLSLSVIEQPRWISNIRISSDTVGTLKPGESRTFSVAFDIPEEADVGSVDSVTFFVETPFALVDFPKPKLTVKIAKKEGVVEKKPEVDEIPVLKLVNIEGPKTEGPFGGPGISEIYNYSPGSSGYSYVYQIGDEIQSSLSIAVTYAPLEIIPGEPFRIEAEVLQKRFKRSPPDCTRTHDPSIHWRNVYRGDSLSPGLSISGNTAVGFTRSKDVLGCGSGVIKFTLHFKPDKSEYRTYFHTPKDYQWEFFYTVRYESNGRDSHADPSERATRLFWYLPNRSLSDPQNSAFEVVIRLIPFGGNVGLRPLVLHYLPLGAGQTAITSVPSFEFPPELLRPPIDGTESIEVAREDARDPDKPKIIGTREDEEQEVQPPQDFSGPVLPDFEGRSVKEANAWLKENGFEVVLKPGSMAPSRELSSAVETQDPPVGTELVLGSTVVLTVHSPYVSQKTIPDLTGMMLADAKEALESQGLEVVLRPGPPAPSPGKSGMVESQQPAAESIVKEGTKVSLKVHPEYVDQKSVPEVTGLSVADAKSRVAQAGLMPVLRPGGAPSSRNQAGKVARMYPEPGTVAGPGAQVEIFVYGPYAETITVPDLKGLTPSEAKNRISDAGLVATFRPGGTPSAREGEGTVGRLDPPAGTRTTSGSEITIFVYGPYVAKVQPVGGPKTPPKKKDYCNCEVDTSLASGNSKFCTMYREIRDGTGAYDVYGRDLVYHIVNDDVARSGRWQMPNGWNPGSYNSCETLLERYNCVGHCPEEEGDSSVLTAQTIVGYWTFTGEALEENTTVDGNFAFFSDGSFHLKATNTLEGGLVNEEQGQGAWTLVGDQLTFGDEGMDPHKATLQGDSSAFRMRDASGWTLRFKRISKSKGELVFLDGPVIDDPIDSTGTFGQDTEDDEN